MSVESLAGSSPLAARAMAKQGRDNIGEETIRRHSGVDSSATARACACIANAFLTENMPAGLQLYRRCPWRTANLANDKCVLVLQRVEAEHPNMLNGDSLVERRGPGLRVQRLLSAPAVTRVPCGITVEKTPNN